MATEAWIPAFPSLKELFCPTCLGTLLVTEINEHFVYLECSKCNRKYWVKIG